MTHFIALQNGEPISVKCDECYLHKMIGDSVAANEVYNFYIQNFSTIHSVYYSGPIQDKSTIKVVLEVIEKLKAEYQSLDWDDLFKVLFERSYAPCSYIISEISNIESYLSYISTCHQLENKNLNNFSFNEINVEKYFIHNCHIHIMGEYHLVDEWRFDIPFVEYVLRDGIKVVDKKCRFMEWAIRTENLELIDYLIDNGVNLNNKHRIQHVSGFVERIDYAYAAASTSAHVLHYMLKRGCHDLSSVISFRVVDTELVRSLIPYCIIKDWTFEQKCDVASSLVLGESLEILQEFEAIGLEITADIMDEIIGCNNDDTSYIPCFIEEDIAYYLISKDISAIYFHDTYENACCNANLNLMNQLEKAGIFEFYRPAKFLNQAALSHKIEILEHILKCGVDPEVDKHKIEKSFPSMCQFLDAKCIALMKPYIDMSKKDLILKTAANYLQYSKDKSKIITMTDYFLENRALSPDDLVFMVAASRIDLLEYVFDKVNDFNFNTRAKVIDVMRHTTPWLNNNKWSDLEMSLAEIVVFINSNSGFESTLDLLLERQLIDPERIIEMTRQIIDIFHASNSYYIYIKLRYLMTKGVFDKNYVVQIREMLKDEGHDPEVDDEI